MVNGKREYKSMTTNKESPEGNGPEKSTAILVQGTSVAVVFLFALHTKKFVPIHVGPIHIFSK